MVAVPGKIMEAIAEYISVISGEIAVEKVFLFGSYAKGTSHKNSDIDIAVYSKDFSAETRIDDMTYLLDKTWGLDFDIQPFPFGADDYEDPVGILEEILKTGMELHVV